MAGAATDRPWIPIGRLGQLLLHDGQRHLVRGCQVLHRDHLARQSAALSITIAGPI